MGEQQTQEQTQTQPQSNVYTTGSTLFWDPNRNAAVVVPNDKIPEVRARGYDLAVPVRGPDGQVRMVPSSKASALAKSSGGKVDFSVLTDEHRSGALSTMFGDLWDTAKNLPLAVNKALPVPGLVYHDKNTGQTVTLHEQPTTPADPITTVKQNLARENKDQRSTPYKVAASVGGTLGVNVGGMEEAADQGDTGAVLGHAGANAAVAAAPLVAGPVGRAVGKAGDFAQVFAKSQYQRALDLPVGMPLDEQTALAQTGLENRIPLTESGLAKTRTKIGEINKTTAETIASNPDATVDPNKIASYTERSREQAGQSVNPKDDVAAVNNVTQEYLEKHGQKPGTPAGRQAGFTGGETPGKAGTPAAPYSAAEAQAEKSATYRKLENDYGDLSTFSKEGMKDLARGIKDQIVEAFPSLKGLGAKEGALLDLQPWIEKAISKSAKKPVVTPGAAITGVGAEAGTGSMGAATAAGVTTRLLQDPGFRSRIAIALNETGKVAGGMKGAFAAYDANMANMSDKLKQNVQDSLSRMSGQKGSLGDQTNPMVSSSGGVTIKRGADFNRLGEYDVNFGGSNYKIFRDPDSGMWYESNGQHFSKNYLGSTKNEALSSLQRKYAPEPVTNNASGESAASMEAINRAASEKAKGITRIKIDTRNGKEVPLIGPDAVDVKPGQYEAIVQRAADGTETLLDKGAKANYKPVPKWPKNAGSNYTPKDLADFKSLHKIE